MKAKRIAGTILIVIGAVLLLLQLFSISGGLPVVEDASTNAVFAYDIIFLLGFLLPGIIGLILLSLGVILRRNTSNVSVPYKPKKDLLDTDVNDMTPEEVLGTVLGVHAKKTAEDIEDNSKNQSNYENDSEFGLVPEKPIYTLGIKLVDGEIEYLNSLRTSDGEKIKWERQGSVSVEGVRGMIDIYDIYLQSGQLYKTIYINMYGAKRSTRAPEGFILNDIVLPTSKPKKEKKQKTKYCSRCGSAINNETRICTGCGRKYFKIRLNKFSVAIIVMSAVIVASTSFNIFQYLGSEKEIGALEAQISSKEKTIEYLLETNSDLRRQNLKKSNELRFFRKYAVVKADDGTRKYHKYGCDDLDTSYFWIYNIEAAEDKGYYACSKCCD